MLPGYGGGHVSLDQAIGPVVYGQHVPSDPAAASTPGSPPDAPPSPSPSPLSSPAGAESPSASPSSAGADSPSASPSPAGADSPSASPSPAGAASPTGAASPSLDGGAAEADSGKFTVRLTNFTGPFDLLLQLISKHKLDVTEVALARVTDEFIARIRGMGTEWDLDEASEFLVIAATLLDLKAARLLPAAEVEDEEDLALLEARDLLFARLLQYKAFKEAASHLAELESLGARRWPRAVAMEPRYAEALPELVLGIGAERLFKLALRQFQPKPGPPEVSIAHIHMVRVSVREHATLLRDRLRRAGSATFSLLVADCENTLEVVARFLALLELYREGLVEFEQPVSLDELTVRWVGGDAEDTDLDIDDYEGSPATETASAEPAESVTDEDIAAMADRSPGEPVDETAELSYVAPNVAPTQDRGGGGGGAAAAPSSDLPSVSELSDEEPS
jgi:segregation and condensation protein A